MLMNKNKLALTVAVAMSLAAPGAFATNGIIPLGNGMVAQGVGGAGLSNAGEASAGMDNPALISQTGDAFNVAWTMFMPYREVDTTAVAGTIVESDSNQFAIPQIALTSKLNDKMNWGILAYAMGGMNTNYRTGMFGGGAPESANLQGMIIAPTISYAFSKDVSAGASLLIGYSTLTGRNLFGSFPVVNNSFDDTSKGFGVKFGVDAKVADGISVVAVSLKKKNMDEFGGFKTFLDNFGFTGDAGIPLPDEAGVGAKFAVGKDLDVVADLLFYKWTSIDVFEFFGWEDQTVLKVGAEWRTSDKLALRAGLNYGKSPISGGNVTSPIVPFGGVTADAAFANYLFPAISETHFTLGFGYKMDKSMTVNAYYLYSPETTETATTTSMGLVPPGTTVSMSQHAFGIGINYRR